MSAEAVETEEVEETDGLGQAVRIQENEDVFYGVAAPELSNKAFFARLSEADQDRVLSGEIDLADLRPRREEEPIDGMEALAEASDYVRRYKPKVMSGEAARKTLALQELVKGTSPAEIKATTGLAYSVYKTWLEPKGEGAVKPVEDKEAVKRIKAAIKKAEDAEKKA